MSRLLVLVLLAFALVTTKATNADVDTGDLANQHSPAARTLLQEDTSDDDDRDNEKEVEKEEKKEVRMRTLVEPGVAKMGPTLFYDGEKFLMQLGKPIQVSMFKVPQVPASEVVQPGGGMVDYGTTLGIMGKKLGKPVAVISLDKPALSVKGSMVDAEGNELQVNLDWKDQDFGSGPVKISKIMIKMKFVRKKDEYHLASLTVPMMEMNGRDAVPSSPFAVTTNYGYKVKAPIGLSFCCYDPGMFIGMDAGIEIGMFTMGLTFPDVQLQAFQLKNQGSFGPEWSCGELMSIGLWIGLLVTFFFALICYYGFSMLANIQTMDRFDDPKGKTIYVPQTCCGSSGVL